METYTLPLTQGQITRVSSEDFDNLNKFKWHSVWNPKTGSFYARRAIRKEEKPGPSLIYMSNYLMGGTADHIDHDTLNNTRENLRLTNNVLNQHNKRKYKGTSQFKGVAWHSRDNLWVGYLTAPNPEGSGRGKRIELYRGASEVEAALAYNKKAKEVFGDWAYLNEIL